VGKREGAGISKTFGIAATGFTTGKFTARPTGRRQRAPAGHFDGKPIQLARRDGAPINWVPLEPVPVSFHSIALSEHAGRPNAAKLYIDFVLSREGQETLRSVQEYPFGKTSMPTRVVAKRLRQNHAPARKTRRVQRSGESVQQRTRSAIGFIAEPAHTLSISGQFVTAPLVLTLANAADYLCL
jgi:hypothetical protein